MALKDIPRTYSRYGLSPRVFEQELVKAPKPWAILVTSIMTYWYPGVIDAITLAKKLHPDVPVIVGGNYIRLCHDHALKYSRADCVMTASDPSSLLDILNDYGIPTPGTLPDSNTPYPAFDMLSRIDYICLLTSIGCPYRCRYCASHYLDPEISHRHTGEVLDEILYWHKNYGVHDFAFYDDALLVDSVNHLAILLEDLVRLQLDIRFHTPNALHVKELTADIARLMHRAGFCTIRLGLETSNPLLHRDLDNKVDKGDFEAAVNNLLKAGFTNNQIGAYVLIGLPGQSINSVIETIDFVGKTGALPFLSEYSPIPHTALWKKAIRHSSYDLAAEPLFHNNCLLPCWDAGQRRAIPGLKKMVLEIRERYR